MLFKNNDKNDRNLNICSLCAKNSTRNTIHIISTDFIIYIYISFLGYGIYDRIFQ